MIASSLAWLALVALAGTVLADAWLPWRDRTDALERIVLTLGLGYAWSVVAGMALNATPWGVRGATFVGATLLLAVVVAGAQRWRGGQACGRPRPLDRRTWLAVAAVIAFAALFRLPNLGWSEFQGDEALVLHKAAATIDGRHDAIYVHKKGPAEILITAEVYAVQRRIDEGTARLPFAVAMLAGLAALLVVGRGLFGARVGLAATVILSLNGFFIAFGRVVQYQALVFLFGTLALWCAWRYRHAADDDRDGAGRWLVLCALFLACGLLSHYDAALTAPAIAYLVVARWRAVPGSLRRERWAVAAGFALGTALLSAFYVPLVRHPYFQSTTLKYLVEVRLGGGGGEGGGAPYDALPKWMGLANFYSSAYYLFAIDLLVAAAVTARLIRRWPRAGWAAAAFGVLAIPALVLRPEWFALTDDIEGRSWAILVIGVALALVVLAAPRDPAWTTTALWLAAPVLFYATLVEAPRTHFHVVFPALSLIAALTIATVWNRLHPAPSIGGGVDERSSPGVGGAGRWATPVAGALAASLAIVAAYSAFYSWMVFVQHDVAYKRGYPDVQVAGAWYPFAELPGSGWFGFPYRAGWKAIGGMQWGGEYDSNEEPAVTAWYSRGAPRCGEDARWMFVADAVQDVQPVLGEEEPRDAPPSDEDVAAAGFAKIGHVSGGGPHGISLWQRGGVLPGGPIELGLESPAVWGLGTREREFDRELTDPHYDAGLPFDDPGRIVDHDRSDVFGEPPTLILDGWSLETPSVSAAFFTNGARAVLPGDQIALTLAWHALASTISPNAQVFVHLEREGDRTIGQADGPPRTPAETVCGKPRPLASLAAGETVLDRRVIDIAPDEPPGEYHLLVGIYDYETGERLPVSAGPDAGTTRVRLAIVNVIAAQGGP
ncbi:MAG: glycosyltransferase family 39 protein [Ardenticatenales bacterium]|nr:glycosyltransferase family 39 protein [Ardenticatenales bacterium]